MLALTAALLLQTSNLPEKPVVDYSGIPTVTGGNVTIQSHSVTLLIAKDHVDVSSLTLVKNNVGAGSATIWIPEDRTGAATPATMMSATWANSPVQLRPAQMNESWHTSHGDISTRLSDASFQAHGAMQNLGTYALRVKYTVPLGQCGFDHKQLLVGYNLASPAPIGTLMVTYSYAPGVVFHEPEAGPAIGWQIGLKGAFVKLTNYDGKAGLSYCAFYPGGFKPIG